jgi:hypothetical protein
MPFYKDWTNSTGKTICATKVHCGATCREGNQSKLLETPLITFPTAMQYSRCLDLAHGQQELLASFSQTGLLGCTMHATIRNFICQKRSLNIYLNHNRNYYLSVDYGVNRPLHDMLCVRVRVSVHCLVSR